MDTPLLLPKPRHASLIWRLLAVFVGLVMVVYLSLAVGVYAVGWHGSRAVAWSQFFPLPAATVGWQAVSASNAIAQGQTLEHYNHYLATVNPTAFPEPRPEESRAMAVTKLIRDIATRNLIHQYGVIVTSADVDQAFTSQVVQSGDVAQVTKAIRELYNWSPEQFKANVLAAAVHREKLQEKISFDDALNTTARTQATHVLAIVQAGTDDFGQIAKTYSEDAYASQGGEVGFVSRGDQSQELDEVLFTLTPGKTSGIIHTKFGFHIVNVEEKKTVDGQDQVRYRSIFIAAPAVDDFITAELKKSPVRVFLPHMHWDQASGSVQP